MTAVVDRLRVFSLREFAVHRGRTLASVVVMAVSASYLIAVFGIFGSISGSVDRLAGGIAGTAALEVSGITDAGFSDSINDDVASIPGVATAAPMLRTSLSTPSGRLLLLGADAKSAALGNNLADALGGQLGSLIGVPNGVLIGPGVGHQKGDSFGLGSSSVTVAGVLEGKRAADLNSGHYVLAPLGLAQRVTDRLGQLDSILIATAPDADLATVRAEVAAAVNGRAIVGDPSARAAQASDGVKLMNYMALMGATVAFVVGAFLMYTTMTMAITQRRPVISILRAIGGRRRTIVADMVTEAAVLGLIGGAIGSGIGIVLGRLAIGRLPPAVTQGLEVRLVYSLPGFAIPAAIAATVLTSVAASAMAARQVYKVSPIEALAPAGASTADFIPRWLRLACGAGAVLVFVAAILVVVAHVGPMAFAAMGALFAAEIALGFALTVPIVKATAFTARIFGSAGALAAATIERAPRRVWATVMTVLIAVVTTVGITGTDNDMIRSARGIFSSVAATDVWVSADAPDTYPTTVLPQGLAEQVAGVPGVARVIEGSFAFAAVGGERVLLDGFSAGTNDSLFNAASDEVRADVLDGRGVVVTQNLGSTLGVGVGDELTMNTPHGLQKTVVLALVPYFSTIIGSIGMDLGQLRQWFDRPGATTLQVTAAKGVDRGQLLTAVRQVVPQQSYVYDGPAALAGLEAPLHQSMFIATAVWIIVVFVAAIALLNTLTLSVLERRREIGVLRAMGSSRRYTLRMILAEAAGIGIVGGILGLVFGLADQWLISLVSGDVMNFVVDFQPSPIALAFAGGALAISLLGSIPPAVRAARQNIIEAVTVD
jgi:putative ABC transport system permease protein